MARPIQITTANTVKRKRVSTVFQELNSHLSLDVNSSEIEDIADKIRLLKDDERKHLLNICENAFSDIILRRDELTRVTCAKVMVALVPESTDSIKKWIDTSTGKSIYEIHFSLFCFLDKVPNLPGGKKFATEIPSIMENYIKNLKSDRGNIAYMAGDLLGDHWEISKSLPVLMRVAKQGRYSAGRESAISGLGTILRKLPDSSPEKNLVYRLIKDVSKNDRSESVRVCAKVALRIK